MRRGLIGVAALALVLLGAGCGEDAGQRAARLAVQRHAGGARTHCTQTARIYLEYVPTKTFICVVDRPGGLCDKYVAIRTSAGFAVRLRQRSVDCVLPAS